MAMIREPFNPSRTTLKGCMIIPLRHLINNGEGLTIPVVGQAGGGRGFPALHARPGHDPRPPLQILLSLKGR